jgi:hypothetical protein
VVAEARVVRVRVVERTKNGPVHRRIVAHEARNSSSAHPVDVTHTV